ncbi:tRNA-guanosine(34) transglycosylase [Candidatus Babeliales bacterium]|nr:tRNA-guanosine(34) transglycosylase [Candidatus Babeliales bacterium]
MQVAVGKDKHFRFELIHQSRKSRARVGRIHTPHGIIDTPSFVAVGTNGTVKTLDSRTVQDLGVQLMFCNTYHLLVQPGTEIIQNAGGLHKFMKRDLPLITDSGGFQVFSLKYGGVAAELKSKGAKKTSGGCVVKVTEDGVAFRSYRDGHKIFLSPETSIQAQKALGADIIVAFDELLPYHIDKRYQQLSLDRTHRWAQRSLEEHKKNVKQQALYAVIHGGVDCDMRKQSCDFLTKHDFDGFGIGGSVGKNRQEMHEMLSFMAPMLPGDKPRHLLGIGDLPSLELCVPLGIDTFDSAHPTKAARHGLFFTKNGGLRILKSGNCNNFGSVQPGCVCHTCKHYSVAYLQHLFKANEPTVQALATIHNVHFMVQLMAEYRRRILAGDV